MMDTDPRREGTLAARLRADARRVEGGLSADARSRLDDALARASGPAPLPERRRVGRRRLAASLALAACVALVARTAWSVAPEPTAARPEDVHVAVRAILDPLDAARPAAVVRAAGEGPLQRPLMGEIDALRTDAAALAGALLRRIPAPLVPNRAE